MGLLRRIGAWLRLRPPRQAWLGDSILLVIGPGRGPRGAEGAARGKFGGRQVRLYRADRGDGRGDAEDDDRSAARLERLLRSEFPAPEERGRALMEVILEAAAPDLDGARAVPLRRSLQVARDALRPPLPRLINEAGATVAGAVDAIQSIDERAYLAIGWLHDPGHAVERLAMISPEGQYVDLLNGAYRSRRQDVEEAHPGPASQRQGFVRYFELNAPSRLGAEWLTELTDRSGRTFELNRPVGTYEPLGTRGFLLHDFKVSRLTRDVEVFRTAHPALARIQSSLSKEVEIERVAQYGEPPEAPRVSIIVPLYRRVDFVEHQLAHFGHDPQIARADLVYLLDSPELAEELGRVAPALQELHDVPFRIATVNRNGGYAVANNLGASIARGRKLLLLNSDVVPVRPGWLETMADFHDATRDIGALGPRLLFEDESIQHAGMYFRSEAETGLWSNQHYFKGFAGTLHAANVSRPVPAVTGACLMVDRELYDSVGGLWPGYIEGGYEDSDLCLRLAAAGKRNWYLAEVELFHLEAQSYRTEARGADTYNSWLQTHLWGDRIAEVMRAQAEGPDAQVLSLDPA